MIYNRYVMAFLLGALILMNTGCSGTTSVEERIEERLEEKYSQKFTVDCVLEKKTTEGYYTAYAYPVNKSDLLFKVNMDIHGNGESDNYIAKRLGNELAERVCGNLGDLPQEIDVYAELIYDTFETEDTMISLDDFFLDNPDMKYRVYISYCGGDQDLVVGMEKAFVGLESVNGTVYLYCMDKDMLGKVRDYRKQNDKLYDDYTLMVLPYYVGKVQIEAGKVEQFDRFARKGE